MCLHCSVWLTQPQVKDARSTFLDFYLKEDDAANSALASTG